MNTNRPPSFTGLLDSTVTTIATLCQRHHNDLLQRNLQIGLCLAQHLDSDTCLHGRGFILKLTQRVNNKELRLGRRLLYHCYHLAAVELPRDLWAKMKVAGLSWRQARDVARLVGKAGEAGRKRVLAALQEAMPRKATVEVRREFQAWLDQQLNPGRHLPDNARYIVLDRVTGRVYSSKLKLADEAERLARRRRRIDDRKSIVVVEVRLTR